MPSIFKSVRNCTVLLGFVLILGAGSNSVSATDAKTTNVTLSKMCMEIKIKNPDTEVKKLCESERLLATLTLESKIAVLKKTLSKTLHEIATNEKDTSIAKAETLPIDSTSSITISKATVARLASNTDACSATPYISYYCNGLQRCNFDIASEDLCALPAAKNTPMVISVDYTCGDRSMPTQFFKYADPRGYLTCFSGRD